MIKLNMNAYLESQGVKLEHGFILRAAKELNINRATVTKYVRRSHQIQAVDLHKLGELAEYLCLKFPEQLSAKDMLREIFVWESFTAAFARLPPQYFIGAVYMPGQSGGEQMTSRRDLSVVENLHRLNPSEARSIILVPYQTPPESSPKPPDGELASARALAEYEQDKPPSLTRVFVGSCKVHLLTIIHLAELFGVDPYGETNEHMPIGLVPRPGEVVPGCFRNEHSKQPGLVWRDVDGTWEPLGFEENAEGVTRDAGLVVIDYHEETDQLNICMFGFSGAGTEALGVALANNPQRIAWPPRTPSGDALVDIYAYRIDLSKEVAQVAVERMPDEVLKQYLPQTTAQDVVQESVAES